MAGLTMLSLDFMLPLYMDRKFVLPFVCPLYADCVTAITYSGDQTIVHITATRNGIFQVLIDKDIDITFEVQLEGESSDTKKVGEGKQERDDGTTVNAVEESEEPSPDMTCLVASIDRL